MLIFFLSTILAFQSAGVTPQSPRSDVCEVYLVDVKTAQRIFDRNLSDSNLEQKMKKAEKTLGRFTTTIGEEEQTTQVYRLPGGKFVTVTVFYTDETMASETTTESIEVAMAVANQPLKNARTARNASVAEIPYTQHTEKLRVKQYIVLQGRTYYLGVECTCTQDKTSEPEPPVQQN